MKKHLTIAAAITLMIFVPLCPAQAVEGKRQTRQLTGTQAAKPKSGIAEKLIGTRKLVSIEILRPNGEIINDWMGRQPTGLIVYEATGRMSVQIMRDPRPTFALKDNAKATPEEKAKLTIAIMLTTARMKSMRRRVLLFIMCKAVYDPPKWELITSGISNYPATGSF